MKARVEWLLILLILALGLFMLYREGGGFLRSVLK